MFSIRNIGGVSLFLFGTTFLWLTPAFATEGLRTTGLAWTAAAALSLAAMAGFAVATWGLFHHASWWEAAALVSTVIGVVVLVPYWIAGRHSGEATTAFNTLIHLAGDAGVLLLLLVPSLEQWVDGHVVAGH